MDIKLYFAPLEGLTTAVFRKVFLKHFGFVDKIFLPFISTNKNYRFKKKDIKELKYQFNDTVLIPQLLSNNYSDFTEMSFKLYDLGYSQINWNIGCPSPTVVVKKKGAGILPHFDFIDKFLDNVLKKSPCKISIKTRTGKENHEEFINLIKIFNKYPLEEIIVHPRTALQNYEGKPDINFLSDVISDIKIILCYNGDIFSFDDLDFIKKRFPSIKRFMIGRAGIFRPIIFEEIKKGIIFDNKVYFKRFLNFHNDLFAAYETVFPGEKQLIFKIKDYWKVFQMSFNDEKFLIKIKRSKNKDDYMNLINEYFN
ncbi:MAG: tRNA-dihydrouridine synthase family protein [Spirochaetes bacterium]|nr:tRNA-dihydrouridine synthase family protein [Spirochaetota bacterium]